MTEPVTTDVLSRLKRYAEQNAREPWIPVKAPELMALVECAEALRDLYDEQNGPPLERRAQQWHNANGRASTALTKLEAL